MGRVIHRADIEASELRVVRMGGEDDPPGPTQPAREAQVAPAQPQIVSEKADPEQEQRVRRLVQAMLAGFARQRRELLSELQPYVVRIAVEVGRRIVRRELRSDPGMVTRIAQAALEQVGMAANVRVRVHPLDARILEDSMMQIVAAPDEAAAIEIVPDTSVEQGGCVVESDRGIVDARLRTQFEEMQTRLLEGLETEIGQGDMGR